MGKKAGLKRPGHRYNAQPAKSVEGFDQAISPLKAQPGQGMTSQRRKPMPPSVPASGPPACIDPSGKVKPNCANGGLDSRKMTPGTAFQHAAAGRAYIPLHKQGTEKSVEKSICKTVSPHMALEAAGAHRGLLPRKFFPKKAYLLEIYVNK